MIDYDPFSHEVMRDPWPFYARLRAEAPAFYLERYDTWFLSRFTCNPSSSTRDASPMWRLLPSWKPWPKALFPYTQE